MGGSLVGAEFVVEYGLEASGVAENGLLASCLAVWVDKLDPLRSVDVEAGLKT